MTTEQTLQEEIAALKTQLVQHQRNQKIAAAAAWPDEQTRLRGELAAATQERDRWRREVNRLRRALIRVDQKIARATRSGWLDPVPPTEPPAAAPPANTPTEGDRAAAPDAYEAAPDTTPDTPDAPRPPNPPTARQLRYARDLARKRRIKLPAACRTDFTACSAFITRHS